MTKQAWQEHYREAHGSKEAWLAARETCPECKARRRTRARSAAARGRQDAMRSCGLVKVRGNLGGIYWE